MDDRHEREPEEEPEETAPRDGFNPDTFKCHDSFGRAMVGVHSFSAEALDTAEERIFERVHKKLEFRDIIEDMLIKETDKAIWEWGARFISFLFSWRKPLLALDQLAWLFGVRSREGASISELAGRHRISKQAFQQGAKRIAESLGIERLSHLRSPEAKTNMRKAHFQPA